MLANAERHNPEHSQCSKLRKWQVVVSTCYKPEVSGSSVLHLWHVQARSPSEGDGFCTPEAIGKLSAERILSVIAGTPGVTAKDLAATLRTEEDVLLPALEEALSSYDVFKKGSGAEAGWFAC